MLADTAVLPLPKRSKAAATRGFRSFQHGTQSTLAKLRSGTKMFPRCVDGGTYSESQSRRRPGLSVSRPLVHRSWMKRPMSGFRMRTVWSGFAYSVIDVGLPLLNVYARFVVER